MCGCRLLVALLAFYVFTTVSAQVLVDEIWHAREFGPGSSFNIVYIVTSGAPDATAALLGSSATLHFARAQSALDSVFYDASHSCAESSSWSGGQPDGADVCPPPELFEDPHPHQVQRKARKRENFFRKAKLWRVARAAFVAADYFVFLDFSGMGWPSLSVGHLVKFERFLEQERPTVAVPLHPCNAVDGAPNSTFISSIYDTRFVAVHTIAASLLLPLHESILSLVCFLMLRGKVVQFDAGVLAESTAQSSRVECLDADLDNQDAMVNFASSLRHEQHVLALPFSPRIHTPTAPHPSAVRFTGAGLIPSVDGNCPVDCSFNYWRSHSAFECCSLVSSSNNAAENYLKLSKRWMLPHPDTLSGVLMSRNNSYEPAQLRQHGFFISHQFVPLPEPRALTHVPQKFQIVLSGSPVILNSACRDEVEDENSALLQHFRLFVVPESMVLRSNGSAAHAVLDIRIQLTLSASEALAGGDDQCVILGRIDRLKVAAGCESQHSSHRTLLSFDVATSTIDQHADSTMAASFYSPGLPWFDLASNVQKDALRRRIVNVPLRTQCLDAAHVTAEATVTVRKFCPQSRRNTVCASRALHDSSQTVTHYSKEEQRRSSFVAETRPLDLYDAAAARAPMRRLQSDFACAGPNRRWPFADEAADQFQNGPDLQLQKNHSSSYSICLLRNVCWIDQRMKLFVPVEFSHLDDFLDFAHVSLGEPGKPEVGFNVVFVFGQSIPEHARFSASMIHYAMNRHWSGILGNFGHAVWEELGGVFHAMHLFDLPRDDGRIVWFNLHTLPRATTYFFPRTPVYIGEYDDGTCFEHMVVGFRGVNSFTHGFSLHRSAHAVEFRKHYLSLLGLQHLTSKRRRRKPVVVNLYPKLVVGNAEVWSDVCALAQTVELLFPRLHFRCVLLHEMSVEVQAQVIAEATIHVWPNGRCQCPHL